MIDLYHRTSPECAARIRATGVWESRENTREAYFSTRPDGMADGYGDAIVHVRVPAAWCQLDDEYPDGEQHYRVSVDRLTRANLVPEES